MTMHHVYRLRLDAPTPAARVGLLVLTLLLATTISPAWPAEKGVRDSAIVSTDAFLAHHPDIRYRQLGLKAYDRKNYAQARTYFLIAAKFADKPSQGMVAEMLWNGEGAPVNRVEAAAWMSLAAERSYDMMVMRRDSFLGELSADERARAEEKRTELMADYGDAIAQPRLERLLRQALSSVTGSRTGVVGAVQILLPSPRGVMRVDGSQFYQDKFWRPAEYWHWQDQGWKPEPTPKVDVGPVDASPSHPDAQTGP